MKICVLVKEVPDAAVEKRIDPATKRLDRSGEKNLNPFDTHAIEAAMQVKEGGKADVEDGKLRCERQAEYGYDTVSVELPAVISVGDAINEPRYPSLKAIMGAKKKQLDTLGAADAGIELDMVGADGSKVQCGNFKAPPQKQAGQIIEDEDTEQTVQHILAWLEERKLLA